MRLVARGAVTRTARLVPLLLALLVLLAVAQVAAAAPPAPTMDLEQLAVALESGPLDGYLLTTMDGTTPEPITVQVQSLVDYSWGSLILFEASGPWIDKIGGIAAGMSGSPIYVDDGGVDKLVGALSYGDAFTLGGLGLATPIEYMAAIEADFAVGALAALQAPRPPAAGAYPLARAGEDLGRRGAERRGRAQRHGRRKRRGGERPDGDDAARHPRDRRRQAGQQGVRTRRRQVREDRPADQGGQRRRQMDRSSHARPRRRVALRDPLLPGRRLGRRRRHRHLRRRRVGDALRAPLLSSSEPSTPSSPAATCRACGRAATPPTS